MKRWIVTVTCKNTTCGCFTGPHEKTPTKNGDRIIKYADRKTAEAAAKFWNVQVGGETHTYEAEELES